MKKYIFLIFFSILILTAFLSCINIPETVSEKDTLLIIPIKCTGNSGAKYYVSYKLYLQGVDKPIIINPPTKFVYLSGLKPGEYKTDKIVTIYKKSRKTFSESNINYSFVLESGSLTLFPVQLLIKHYRKNNKIYQKKDFAGIDTEANIKLTNIIKKSKNAALWKINFFDDRTILLGNDLEAHLASANCNNINIPEYFPRRKEIIKDNFFWTDSEAVQINCYNSFLKSITESNIVLDEKIANIPSVADILELDFKQYLSVGELSFSLRGDGSDYTENIEHIIHIDVDSDNYKDFEILMDIKTKEYSVNEYEGFQSKDRVLHSTHTTLKLIENKYYLYFSLLGVRSDKIKIYFFTKDKYKKYDESELFVDLHPIASEKMVISGNKEGLWFKHPEGWASIIDEYHVFDIMAESLKIQYECAGGTFTGKQGFAFDRWHAGGIAGKPIKIGYYPLRNWEEPAFITHLHETGHNATLSIANFNYLFPHDSIYAKTWREAWANIFIHVALEKLKSTAVYNKLPEDQQKNMNKAIEEQKIKHIENIEKHEKEKNFNNWDRYTCSGLLQKLIGDNSYYTASNNFFMILKQFPNKSILKNIKNLPEADRIISISTITGAILSKSTSNNILNIYKEYNIPIDLELYNNLIRMIDQSPN